LFGQALCQTNFRFNKATFFNDLTVKKQQSCKRRGGGKVLPPHQNQSGGMFRIQPKSAPALENFRER
jgi:hypothetical protein